MNVSHSLSPFLSTLLYSFLLLQSSLTSSFQLLPLISKPTSKDHFIRMTVVYPTKIKNVITKMTESTQSALQKMTSRMEIELPPGVDFGVEASGKQASRSKKSVESNTDKIRRSNREAARLVADMFSVLSTSAVALFPSETEASEARVKWGSSFKGQIFSIDTPSASKGMGNLYSKRISSQEQEQALLGTDGVYIPEGTQIIIVAGPRPKDIKKLKKIHDRLGQDTLIVFINARASIAAVSTNSRKSIEAEGEFEAENIDWVTGAFTTVFHYAPPLITSVSSDSAATEGNLKRDLLLYHEFGGDWYLAEKEVNEGIFGSGISLPSITGNSGFKTIWEGKDRPGKIDIINLLKF